MKTPTEFESAVIAAYLAAASAPGGCPTGVIADQFGVWPTRVRAILARHDVALRPVKPWARYELDEGYFADIDTEAKAYWLGFIAADGCVHKHQGKHGFSMRLAERDRAHLEKFRTAVGYTGPITSAIAQSPSSDRKYPACVLAIGRTVFCDHLMKQGIVPRKSWCLALPTGVPDELLRHYWRGMVDGDGSISKHRHGNCRTLQWEINLVGTQAIADGFASFVLSRTNIALYVAKRRNIWAARTCGVLYPQVVGRLLYEGATVYLARKKARIDELLKAPNLNARSLLVGGLVRVASECAAELGLHPSTIHRRRRRLKMTNEQAVSVGDLRMRPLTFRGQTRTIDEWAEITGVKAKTIYERRRRGDSPERSLRPLGT